MARGLMVVEAYPASDQEAPDFHAWYEKTHMPELLGIDGIVAARRYVPVDSPGGPFVALYEIEAEDLGVIRARISDQRRAGDQSPPVGLRMDPPPVVRILELIAELT